MNLQQLKYAVVAAESGSFREAARRLYMAQSSLSTSIKELEEEFEIQIFERSKRGIFITKEGSEFLSYARDILSQVDVLEARYSEEGSKRLFSISAQHYDFVSEAFSQLINEASESTAHFRLLETSTNQVLQDVRNAYSELGVIYMNDFNRRVINQYLGRYEMTFEPLGTFAPHIFVGNHHPLADRKSVSLADLEAYPILRFEQDTGSSTQFTEEAVELEESESTMITVSDRAVAINVLENTQAYLAGTGILTSLFNQHMRTIPISDSPTTNEIGYIQVRYRKLSDLGQKFIKMLKKAVADNSTEEENI
ncbi:transcriptional regulator [Aerococcus urinaehominis]|uniref:Transcriptional regulator n=1 Tax=Aerococcus urinaehominis TaxID=128944 RepID=A0A0X8FL84_9LACT|nr:LysR family transcriptional regulator [Aerococcus urinaehominis]AMB99359.1 transcriptional regulator [Aerococcus urinaehominis]SDM22254.1 DNA-binding transcriptional regulator, LysR family [Aerococcus urinaehominis]